MPASAGVIVSAADARYFRSLVQLLASVERVDPTRSLEVICYDLGLAPKQRARIAARFPRAIVRRRDLQREPEFMRLRQRAHNTNAWKPQLLAELLDSARAPLLWLDSASVLVRHPARLLAFARRHGLYTPYGGHSSIARWTHPATAAYFGLSVGALTPRMRASGVLALDPENALARALVERWARACRDPACVAPAGAERAHHNFDQSVLNLLLLEARRQHALTLTDDELDISASRPIRELRTRNKLPAWLPLWLDLPLRAYFASYRACDVALLRLRRSRLCPPAARDLSQFSAW
jgi:hypothetical protein